MNSLIFLGFVMLIFYSLALWIFAIKPILKNRHQPITEQEIKKYKNKFAKRSKDE